MLKLSKITETWVKTPSLREASILLAAECVRKIYPELFKKLAEGREAFVCCPETENPTMLMGKLASIIT
ncbi:4Fe-4S ferredoxin, partial [Candidatus Bathyarchaeota archaeon]